MSAWEAFRCAVLGVEDAVMRLNPASTNLVEIRAKRT
jgi:hypothetical protein